MSNFARFMKRNKIVKPNVKFVATKTLTDEAGKPLEWEIKALSTKDTENIRESCTFDVPVKGKANMYRPKLNTEMYMAKMLAKSVVYPDLLDAELQDSYGVTTPEDLIMEMVEPNEYSDFVEFVQNFNGMSDSLQDEVAEAKN